jgi:hypothetical protein
MHGMHTAISKVEKLGKGFVLLAEVCPWHSLTLFCNPSADIFVTFTKL